jgi:TATA-box binding protein (TBP) (component of TFIID and TFIIIB)
MNPTPLRISTMTVTGHLGATPDLKQLYDHGSHIPYWWVGEGIIKIEFGAAKKGICTEDILHTTTKAKKSFFNQSSLVFRLARSDGSWKETNIKLFKNGGFQMTGVSSEEMARAALTRLIALNKSSERGIWVTEPYIKVFDVCMMNSDYTIGRAIRRDRLYKILVEEYGLWSSFEPTIYQGVNTKFFWNKTRPATAPPGICVCPTPCEGDGGGYAVGSCKKITISPFRTGSIIITGAKHQEQLDDAYAFMNGVLRKYEEQVLRDDAPEPAPPSRKKTVQPPTTFEGIIRQKMRASPRNVVRLAAAVVPA